MYKQFVADLLPSVLLKQISQYVLCRVVIL